MVVFDYNGKVKKNGELDYPFSDSVGPIRTYRANPFFNKVAMLRNANSEGGDLSVNDVLGKSKKISNQKSG